MSLELNEEIDIKSETIEDHDFISSEVDIKNEAFEEQDKEFQETSGHIATLSGNKTDIEIDMTPFEIGGEVVTIALMTKSIPEYSFACQICSKEYRLINILKKHLRYEHKVVVDIESFIKCLTTCSVCNIKFASQCSFNVHLLNHAKILHPLFSCEKENIDSFACKICGVTQNSNAKVVQHIKSVHLGLKQYKCKVCSTYFKVRAILFEHFRFQHSLEPFPCVLCSFQCWERMDLKTHLLGKHKLDEISVASLLPAVSDCRNTLNCKVCEVEFKSYDEFRKHVSDVHEGVDEFKCPVCQEDFTCIITLIAHLFNHHATSHVQDNEFKSNGTSAHCKKLSGNETDIEIYKRPIKISEKDTTSLLTEPVSGKYVTCEICSKKFYLRSHLTQHLKKVHEVEFSNPYLTCFQCHEVFITQYNFSLHLLSHAEILHPLFSSEKKYSYTNTCKVCCFTQKSKDKVIQHIKSVHLGIKEYKCKVCSTYFTQKKGLIEHFSLQHSSIEPFICKICSYKWSFRCNLKKHLQLFHKLDENSVARLLPADTSCNSSFICKVCNIVCKSLLVFHQHVSDVHVGLDQIKCPVCQEDFTCIATFIIHLHAHGDTKLQPFSCEMCEERFATENDRSTHLVNFHNKSPDGSSGSSCNECDTRKKDFITIDQLKEHNNVHHNSNSFSSFKYVKCDMFGSYDNLEKHIAAKHSDDSSFTCSVCKETFSSVQSLKIHSANMHENTFETSQFDNTELRVSPDTNIGIVRCEICKQDFDNPTSLMDHFNKIHKNNQKQASVLKNRRERQKVSQREHRTAEYLKNRLGSSPVKPQLQQAMEVRKVKNDCKSTGRNLTEICFTKVKPCCVLLDRGEVTRYLARLDKREEGTAGSSPIEDLPPPLATPPVRVYPSHPCGRVRVTSDHLLSAATSNVGLVCNNIGPRTVVETKQLCVVNSGDGEASSNNCIKSENLASQQLGNFEKIYIK